MSYLDDTVGLTSWLVTKDHKRIAILFLIATTAALILGGVYALILLLELLTPGPSFLSAMSYNRMFTLHGAAMIFLFMIPAVPGIFGNFCLPLMLGATLWYRSASDTAFDAVRDRIADVMAHLQESLSGVRIVTAHNRQRRNVAEHRAIALRYRQANDATVDRKSQVRAVAAIGVIGGVLSLSAAFLLEAIRRGRERRRVGFTESTPAFPALIVQTPRLRSA